MSVVHEFEPPKKSPKPAAAAGGDGGGSSELLERVVRIEATMATKDDLAAVRGELAAVRIDFEKLRTDFEKLRVEVANIRSEFHREMTLQTWRIIGMSGAMVAATYFIATHFGR